MSLKTIIGASGMIGFVMAGYGMWGLIAPGEEKRKEILRNLPEGNPQRMEETRKRNALVMQALKDAAETEDNIARDIAFPTWFKRK